MNSILKLFSLKFISSVLGVLSSIITVRLFGASRLIEVYFAAQSLVYLVTSLTQSGQLAEIFLPEYHKLKVKSGKLAFIGLSVVINRFFLWGVFIICVVFLCAPLLIQLIVPGFSIEEQQQAVLIFRVLLPYLLLQLFNSFFITVLNAEKKFGRAEFLSISNIIINISLLLMLYNYIGIWALVISVMTGKVVEFIFYWSQLYKIGFRHRFVLSKEGFNHKSFFKTMQSTIMYVGATQVYSVVLTAGISFLPEGTFAIFKYVQGLSGKIKGLVIQPFMTIFFTTYSSLLQSARSVKDEFNKYFTSILAVNTVTIIGILLLGDVFIEILWGGRKFTPENIQLAYVFLIVYSFSIFLSAIGGVYRKMAVAHGRGKKLYQYWVFSQMISAISTYLLLKFLTVNGLFIMIPLNVLLMSSVSIIVYYGTKEPIRYKIMNFKSLFLLILPVLAYFLKQKVNVGTENLIFELSIYLGITAILSIYPIINIYKVFKVEKSNR